MVSYVMQATRFFTIGFCLWPADVNRHGGGRVFCKEAAGAAGRDLSVCVILVRRLLVGWRKRYRALSGFLWLSPSPRISALLLLPF